MIYIKILNRNKQLKTISEKILIDIDNSCVPDDLKYYLSVKNGIVYIMDNKKNYEEKRQEYRQLGIINIDDNWRKHLKILILFK